jgi:hypothetical protein
MPLITQGFAASLRVGTFGRWYYDEENPRWRPGDCSYVPNQSPGTFFSAAARMSAGGALIG